MEREAEDAGDFTFKFPYDIRTVEELLGDQDVRTTMIHIHVLNRGGRGVRSPADGLVPDPDER